MLLWSFLILFGIFLTLAIIGGHKDWDDEGGLGIGTVLSFCFFLLFLLFFILPGPRTDRTWILQFEQAKSTLLDNRKEASPLERVQILQDIIKWNNELIDKQRGYTNPWISNTYAPEVMNVQPIK